MASDQNFNGWRNWQTWNVALWLFNDESLYSVVRRYRNARTPYESVRRALSRQGVTHTGDDVSLNDRRLSRRELNAAIREE